MIHAITRIGDRLLQRVAPKMTASAVCGGWQTCCYNRRVGVRRYDPEHGSWCTPCYTTSQSC
ncbi:hypothetical protein [Bailinhaonella thermotolerans]|uniref:Uncharacterized protein n=1 Tax=Bailinhaonella thermotolerans TaxID=1070861 RepID=A0A3A4A5C7_9ACTN|nr:hypothetical protein [Bailinhaonella thermotolerans]RJL20822.1 hypothetical protein D5H75_38865 [Bailinhaonella thermotolerans]